MVGWAQLATDAKTRELWLDKMKQLELLAKDIKSAHKDMYIAFSHFDGEVILEHVTNKMKQP
jgi:hypothetical protein